MLSEEVARIQQLYLHYRILPYYSRENLLYHPENLASLNRPGFDPEAWRETIHAAKTALPPLEVKYARSFIRELRDIPEFQKTRAWESDAAAAAIHAAFQSEDFERYYLVLPMKKVSKQALERFAFTELELARAPWFMQTLKELTN